LLSIRIASFGLGILTAFLASSLTSSAQETDESVYGYWVNRNGWIIETAPCGEEVCGHIVAVGGRRQDSQRLDEFNPDPNLRDRPLCGVPIFGSFVPNGMPGKWEDGWIYNPQDGKTYSSNMALEGNGTLEVRGFVLSPIFGRTVVLNRVEEPDEPCDPSESATEAGAGEQ
jgi:uncharacterized protein (DUF2147 family)